MGARKRQSGKSRHSTIQRMAGWARANQPAMLSLELFVFTWLARLALGAAIASNYDKARWVVAHFSDTGAWSPAALAGALELSFGVSAYFLAARIQETQRRWRDVLLLAFVTTLFAGISAVANVAYFVAHATAVGPWVLAQAIALGVAKFNVGAVLKQDGTIELLGRSDQNTAPARETLALVLAAVRQHTAEADVVAGALVGLMQVTGPKGPIDGIRIEVDHRRGVPTIVFLPYIRQASGQLAFGQQATRPGSNAMFEHPAAAPAKAPAAAPAKSPAAAKP